MAEEQEVIEPKEKSPEELIEEELQNNVYFLQSIAKVEGGLNSPLDINLTNTIRIKLPILYFTYYDVITKKVKLKNNGRTMIMNCTWPPKQHLPYLMGGPFNDKYVFSQLHFHWGKSNMEGSEHTVDNCRLPLEMHVVHFKSIYGSHEKAVKHDDGIVIVVYFYYLSADINPAIQKIVQSIDQIEQADTHIRLENFPLDYITTPFNIDYFLYFGAIHTSTMNHNVIWIICRHLLKISTDQIEYFRHLYDANEEAMLKNFRSIPAEIQPRQIFHVNPSTVLYSTLLLHMPPEDVYVKPELPPPSEESDDEEGESSYYTQHYSTTFNNTVS